MMAVEFEELHRTDLTDKLVALFGGLPEPAFKLVPGILHVALDIFLMKAIPNHDAIKNWSMKVGYVLYEPDEDKVLCLSKNSQGVELKDAKKGINLDNSLCLKDITSIKSIYEKFKKCSLVDNLDIVNISQLYQNCV